MDDQVAFERLCKCGHDMGDHRDVLHARTGVYNNHSGACRRDGCRCARFHDRHARQQSLYPAQEEAAQ